MHLRTRAIHFTRLVALLALALLALPQATFAKDEQSWTGRVTARPNGAAVGTWVVQGRSFAATSATQIKEEIGPLAVGSCAEVKYASANGSDTATRIERQPEGVCGSGGDDDNGNEQKVYAVIQSLPAGNIGTWQIGGQAYIATASTVFEQEDGPLAVGACAEVEFIVANGSNTARSIGTEDTFRCGNTTFLSRARGTITAFPSGLTGTWQIGGASYEAVASTRFEQNRPFVVGGCAQVSYFIQNGVSVAQEIESEGADDCVGAAAPAANGQQKLYAPIDTLPASPFVGAWRIGGVDFVANAATRLEQNGGPFVAGACVEAKYVRDASSNRLLAVESKPATRCQSNGVAALQAFGTIDSFPAGLATGTWTVGGVAYQTTASTSFEQRFGGFAAGAFVEISYRVEGATRVASRIETHVAPGAGRINSAGALESRPNDDNGTWVIGGVPYRGDDAIEVNIAVETERPNVALRAIAADQPVQVLVNGYQASDGTLYATAISVVRQVFLPAVQR